jgi:pyruvate/2-oxoglutarate dehydrogenase complex dihydrolipoamide acyltransferase (E2) component
LRHFPLLNASLDGNNIVYHNEIHISASRWRWKTA